MITIDYIEFLKLYKMYEKPVVLYGAGMYGKRYAAAFSANSINVSFFCDMDINKQDIRINEIPVVSPQKLEESTKDKDFYLILSVSEPYIEDVLSSIKGYNFYDSIIKVTPNDELLFFLEKINIEEWLEGVPRHIHECYDIIPYFSENYFKNILHAAHSEMFFYHDGIARIRDYSSSLINYSNGIRRTGYTKSENTNFIYFFGDSRIRGYYNEDISTIESYMQALINSKCVNYNVANYGTANPLPIYIFHKQIISTKFKADDIVILGLSLNSRNKPECEYRDGEWDFEITFYFVNCIAQYLNSLNVRFLFVALPCIDVVTKPSHHESIILKMVSEGMMPLLAIDDLARKKFYDLMNSYQIPYIDFVNELKYSEPFGSFFIDSSHFTPKANKYFANRIFDNLFTTLPDSITKRAEEFQIYSDNFISEFKTKELVEYLDKLKSISIRKPSNIGAIVMNCNPFTNGHRYLIETAASLVDQLYVFILEEEGEKPLFNFRIRKELVIKGVEDLKNVVVLNSGSFIISKITFPEYFQKDDLISQRIDCTKDVLSFCENIVPALNLKKRFVGTEPTCNVTSQYNLALKEILPKYGVELIEIERKVHNDSAISASTVRRLIKKKKYGEIKDIVPRTTYEYIVRTFE